MEKALLSKELKLLEKCLDSTYTIRETLFEQQNNAKFLSNTLPASQPWYCIVHNAKINTECFASVVPFQYTSNEK